MKRNADAAPPWVDGETVEIRRILGSGQTASYIVRIRQGSVTGADAGNPFLLKGDLIGFDFAGPDVDGRITNQRESIDRLLAHLREHCPQLNGAGECRHIKEDLG